MGIGAAIAAALKLTGLIKVLVTIAIEAAISTAANALFGPKGGGRSGERPGRTGNIRASNYPHEVVYGECRKGGLIFFINGTEADNDKLHSNVVLASHECEEIGNVWFNGEQVSLKEDGSDADGAPRFVPAATEEYYLKYANWSQSGRAWAKATREEIVTEAVYSATVVDPAGSYEILKGGGDPAVERVVEKGIKEVNKYDGLARVKKWLGYDDQVADRDLRDENTIWTVDHRNRGNAYIYVRLKDAPEVFTSFIPAITAKVKGQNKVYDPRIDAEVWTSNPALIVADIAKRYMRVPEASIDTAHLIAAADACDELVAKKDASTEKRYCAGGFFELQGDPEEWILPFVAAMGGNFTEHGGVYYINAGVWKGPELTITEDEVLGAISYRTAESDHTRSNAVKGIFISPETFDQPTEYPPVKDAVAIAEDGGETKWLELDLEMVPSHTQAQRLASIALQENREDEIVEILVTPLIGLDVKQWDTVQLDFPSIGLDGTWRIILHRINPGNESDPTVTVSLSLKRHTEDVYEWSAATQEQDLNEAATNIPGTEVARPRFGEYSLTLNASDPDHVPAEALVTWTDPSVEPVEIEVELELDYDYRVTGAGGWTAATINKVTTIGPGAGTANIDIDNPALTDPSGYEFQNWSVAVARMRAYYGDGIYSEWVTVVPS